MGRGSEPSPPPRSSKKLFIVKAYSLSVVYMYNTDMVYMPLALVSKCRFFFKFLITVEAPKPHVFMSSFALDSYINKT